MHTITTQRLWHAVVVCLCLMPALAWSQQNTTVLGPTNADLYEGAQALMAGDAEEGLRRTLRGLEFETSKRDRTAGLSNVCAGYTMIGEPEKGLPYCNEALELNDQNWRALSNRALVFVNLGQYEEAEADLQKAEAIAPNARTVKVVRSMLLDAVDPVAPLVIIDDRRQSTVDEDEP